MKTVNQKVQTKIFLGIHLRPDLRLALEQSSQWQQAQIGNQQRLLNLSFQGKEYIGLFAEQDRLDLRALETLQHRVLGELQSFCAPFDVSKLKAVIFPQTFVS